MKYFEIKMDLHSTVLYNHKIPLQYPPISVTLLHQRHNSPPDVFANECDILVTKNIEVSI